MEKVEIKFNANSGEWFLDKVSDSFWKLLTASQKKQLHRICSRFSGKYCSTNEKEYEITLRQGSEFSSFWFEFRRVSPTNSEILFNESLQYGAISRRGKVDVLTHQKDYLAF
jgi:hypothetical protein